MALKLKISSTDRSHHTMAKYICLLSKNRRHHLSKLKRHDQNPNTYQDDNLKSKKWDIIWSLKQPMHESKLRCKKQMVVIYWDHWREHITWGICFSEYCTSSTLGTWFTGTKPAPNAWDGAEPMGLDTFKAPTEKEVPLPSSVFTIFEGWLIESKESLTVLLFEAKPIDMFVYALFLCALVPSSGTLADLSASLLTVCPMPADVEGPGCY